MQIFIKLVLVSIIVLVVSSTTVFAEKPNSNNDFKTHFDKGVSFLNQKITDKAINEFKTAIQINPKSAEAHFYLGMIYDKRRDYFKAERELNIVRDIDPKFKRVHLKLAEITLQDGNTDNAIYHCNEEIKINPNEMDSYRLLGSIYYPINKNKAIQMYRIVLKNQPDDFDTICTLASIYRDYENDYLAAKEYFKALKIKPFDRDIQVNFFFSLLNLIGFSLLILIIVIGIIVSKIKAILVARKRRYDLENS